MLPVADRTAAAGHRPVAHLGDTEFGAQNGWRDTKRRHRMGDGAEWATQRVCSGYSCGPVDAYRAAAACRHRTGRPGPTPVHPAAAALPPPTGGDLIHTRPRIFQQ